MIEEADTNYNTRDVMCLQTVPMAEVTTRDTAHTYVFFVFLGDRNRIGIRTALKNI